MSETALIAGIMASAIVVLGGLVALTRVLLRVRDVLRDNIRATNSNTVAIKELSGPMADRVTALEARLDVVESRGRRGRPASGR